MEQLVKVTRGGQITIPAEMRGEAGIEIGDYIEVRLEGSRLMLLPKQVIDKDQAWFWTEEWQAAEREVEEDLRAGRVKTFDNLSELVADLEDDKATA
jgi:AbrB family looped-hinge helix DNA binding protein